MISLLALLVLLATVIVVFGARSLLQYRRTGDTGWRSPAESIRPNGGAGSAGVLAAQIGLGASWRIGVDPNEHTQLVSTGAFALVRNPIFTAMLAFCAGLALAVPNLAGLLLAIAGVEWQVRTIEEPYLHKTHGTTYTQYAATTGRFLPGIGRLR